MSVSIEFDSRDRVRVRTSPLLTGVELFGSHDAFMKARERAQAVLRQGNELLKDLFPQTTISLIQQRLATSHEGKVTTYRDGLIIPGKKIGDDLPTISHVSLLAGRPGGREEATRLTVALIDADMLAVYFESGARYPRYADITTVYEAIRDGVDPRDEDYVTVGRLTVNTTKRRKAHLWLTNARSDYFDRANARSWIRELSDDLLNHFV